MIRIAVVDDDPQSRELLRGYLGRFQEQNATTFAIEEFDDGATLTAAYAPRFDIVFLDVQMPRLDGFATARIIRETDAAVILIFVTNVAQFAVNGYEVDALNYLLKPVPYFAFAQELLRCLERISSIRDEFVLLGTGADMARVNLRDVVHVESVKHRLVYHAREGEHTVTGTLRDAAAELEPKGFFRSNSFLLVNLRHVARIVDATAWMSDGSRLPVSRARRKGFLEALGRYFGGRPV